MATRTETPRLSAVADEGRQQSMGERLKERRLALGLSRVRLANRAHIDRDTLRNLEEGHDGVRETTVVLVDRALNELEEEMGMNDPEENGHVVRFVVRGVYGADALIVEGPVENIAELEASVDRIMRRLRRGEDDRDS
jgi:transcriptional regulator with XRE-family HTH domain